MIKFKTTDERPPTPDELATLRAAGQARIAKFEDAGGTCFVEAIPQAAIHNARRAAAMAEEAQRLAPAWVKLLGDLDASGSELHAEAARMIREVERQRDRVKRFDRAPVDLIETAELIARLEAEDDAFSVAAARTIKQFAEEAERVLRERARRNLNPMAASG